MPTATGDPLGPNSKDPKKKAIRQATRNRGSGHSDGAEKFSPWLATFAKFGFPGLVLFVFLVLLFSFVRLPIFGKMDPLHTFYVVMTFLILVFVFALVALLCSAYVKIRTADFKKAQFGIALIALIVCGVGAWASAGKIKENIAKSYQRATKSFVGPQVPELPRPEFVANSKWNINLRLKGRPSSYVGDITFHNDDQSFDASGYFSNNSAQKHSELNCPLGVRGTWSYVKDTGLLSLQSKIYYFAHSDPFIPDGTSAPAASSPPPIDPCTKMAEDFWRRSDKELSANCKLKDNANCEGNEMKLELTKNVAGP